MPVWGELFADPVMQGKEPDPELMALIPVMQQAGCRRVLDAGCGVGRHLLPLLAAGFQVWGVDYDARVLQLLQDRLKKAAVEAAGPYLAQADLNRLPFVTGAFDLAVSIKVINHGSAATFREYCRELDRVVKPGGHLFINVSPWEFALKVKLPQTRELEPGTLVDIATPDGAMIHHFPTPEELRDQFPGYRLHRWETILSSIQFMGNVEMPQLIFWGQKGR
ncbi:MAG: methyltransferase domain-containing protein [Syntrophobacterales bacterium]|jgi:SAM-dependent methyltransferase|nr:methyltransferase domain-containing protein [Syntrophobacterales bacterium]